MRQVPDGETCRLRKDEWVSRLENVVLDLERHSAEAGWDAPPRLYALVAAAELRRDEPALAEDLGISPNADSIAALEQPPLPGSDTTPIEDLLGTIVWPARVDGCALVLERIVLPPEAEAEVPDGPADLDGWAAGHPRREDVRVVVGVLRDGSRHSALRLRKHDDDDAVLSGPDLVPALADALAATLTPAAPHSAPEDADPPSPAEDAGPPSPADEAAAHRPPDDVVRRPGDER
jgi:hypothetical protein